MKGDSQCSAYSVQYKEFIELAINMYVMSYDIILCQHGVHYN